ncbi:ABC transporter ATP-binding protein [Nonomuraea sp. NPDC049725]|uniref:ABC transporter ATP-binding protein n=1 Tax=Nonomuraea sp. NPDC049725 TaxID=3154508 RepID=UPI00343C98E1
MSSVVVGEAAAVVALRGIAFSYRGGSGVRDLDLTASPGDIVALLGPNGAGKTTTIKMLAGLLLPSSGEILVDGRSRDVPALRRLVGYAPCGERGLYPRLSARDNLRLFAALHGLSRSLTQERVAATLRQVELDGVADKPVNALSRGMRQRLHIARALLHRPRLLLIDEPTLGVDPEAARGVRLLLKSLAADGAAVVLATNYLPEAADLCSRLVVLRDGRSIFSGPPGRLMEVCAGRTVSETLLRTGMTDEQVATALGGLGTVHVVRRGELCLVEVLAGENEAPDGERIARLLGAPSPSWHAVRAPNLEDAYSCLARENTE